MAVAILALVFALEVAQMRGWAVTTDSSSGHTRDSGGVVTAVGQRGISDVMTVSNESGLGQQSRVLQVTVRDTAVGIYLGHEVCLNVFREGMAPDVPLSRVVVVDPTHAGFGRVSRAEEGGRLWHDLCEVRGAVAEAGCERGEGIDVGAETGGDADTIPVGLVEGQLEGAEQAGRTGDGH